jgi:1,4-dihydroxy-2-naphthoate octaprenyltransferase
MAPHVNPIIFTLTLLFSLLIQIGTNFANDYFDFMKGADSPLRKGPKRATQQGWIAPQSMLFATFFIFASALFIAIPLMIQAGLWSVFVAAACVLFGILYTGGSKPLGYLGLGEILVLLFFGPVATLGAFYLQTGATSFPVFIASLAPGFLSCAILIANNLRDEESDRAANKKTLVVRFGPRFGKLEYIFSLLIASVTPFLLVFFFKAPPRLLFSSIPFFLTPRTLQGTALLQILYTLLFLLLW